MNRSIRPAWRVMDWRVLANEQARPACWASLISQLHDADAVDAAIFNHPSQPDQCVIDSESPVVASPQGCSYMAGKDSYHNYTGALRLVIREWNVEVGWQVKNLRNAVPTALAMTGMASDASEQYMGHAPKPNRSLKLVWGYALTPRWRELLQGGAP